MARIGISLLSVDRNIGGQYQYAVHFTRSLLGYDQRNQYIVFYDAGFDPSSNHNSDLMTDLEETLRKPNVTGVAIRPREQLRWSMLMALGVWLTGNRIRVGIPRGRYSALGRVGLDLLIQPLHGVGALLAGVPYLISIFETPQQSTLEMRRFVKRSLLIENILTVKFNAALASGIIVESQSTKSSLIREYGVPKGRIHLLPFTPAIYVNAETSQGYLAEVKRKYDLPGAYLFYPAGIEQHKNHVSLVEALDMLRQLYGLNIPLVLVGNPGNAYEELMGRVQSLGLGEQVRYLGYVPDGDMGALYRLALCLIFPTLLGPTNIPVIEAFASGCPVICSNVEGYPEQVGEAGLLVDPLRTDDLAQAIYRMFTDEQLRQTLVERGRARIQQNMDKPYGRQILEIIERVLAGQSNHDS